MGRVKQIKGKIIFKHQTQYEWEESNNGGPAQYIPDVGEMIIYDPDDSIPYARIKFGDGEKIVKDLPFFLDIEDLEFATIENVEDIVQEKTVDFVTSSAVDSKISTHNTSITAHDDIRQSIDALESELDNTVPTSRTINGKALSNDVILVSADINGVEGKTFTITNADGTSTEMVAQSGAEVFNNINNIATGEDSHAEGRHTTASGTYSHVEGNIGVASGECSHAEGFASKALGKYSHAEGTTTSAQGLGAHAEGADTIASAYASHAEGIYTIASGKYSHVQGKYNIEDTLDKYAHIVGNGEFNKPRSNAHTLDWGGNAWFAGEVKVGGTGQDDVNAKTLVTTDYLDSIIAPPSVTLQGDKLLISAPASALRLKNYNIVISRIENGAFIPETSEDLSSDATEFDLWRSIYNTARKSSAQDAATVLLSTRRVEVYCVYYGETNNSSIVGTPTIIMYNVKSSSGNKS